MGAALRGWPAVAAFGFAVALLLYAITLSADLQAADSGELQIAAFALSIPHPPGYPLYTLLAWLAARLPISPAPYAGISLLSALTSALAVAITAALPGSGGWARRLAGLGAAIALATSVTFWAQATTANIRSLTALLVAVMVACVVFADAARGGQDWRARGPVTGVSPRFLAARRGLLLFALAFGLGIGHHASLAFPGVVLGSFVMVGYLRARATPRDRALGVMAAFGLFAAAQVLWLLLPLRTAAPSPLAHADLSSLNGFLDHALARGFEGDFFYFVRVEPQRLGDRLALLPGLLTFQFSLPVLAVLALGWAGLIWRRRALGLTLAGAFGLHMFVTLAYRAPQTVEYALPAWLIAVAGAGLGIASLAETGNQAPTAGPDIRLAPAGSRLRVRSRTNTSVAPAAWRPLAARLAAIAPAGLGLVLAGLATTDGVSRYASFAQTASDHRVRGLAEAALAVAPRDGVILAQWHQATPIWGLQTIEGLRPDARVRYVFPEGAEPYEDTYARRATAVPATVLTVFGPQFAARGLCASPAGPLPVWQVGACPAEPVSSAVAAVFDKRFELVSVEVVARAAAGGQALARVSWRSLGAIGDGDALTVRLLYPDGRLAANTDIQLAPVQAIGESRSQLISLGIPLDVAPGPQVIRAGAYRAAGSGFVVFHDAAGAEFPAVAGLQIDPPNLPPVTARPGRWPQSCAPGRTPELIGVDYDLGLPGKMRLYTHWTTEVAATLTLRSPAAPPAQAVLPAAGGCATVIFDTNPAKGLALDVGGRTLALPDPRPGERYVPFADGITLMSAGIQRRGDDAVATFDWQASQPVASDIKVSARVFGEGAFRQHDGTPALGAIPTLKWIAGTRVADVHYLGPIGNQAALLGDVKLYDNFTQLPLPALDPRYERDGVPFFREQER